MDSPADTMLTRGHRDARLWLAVTIVVLIGAFVRLFGLGSKSLWADEFCTWHVSRLPFFESLVWPPELTKPPAYQTVLRLFTTDPHPPEWMLRWPAAIAGILTLPAAFWFGRMCGGVRVAFALTCLLALQPFHIHHSQDARPYSMLVLGCLVSTGLWYRFVTLRYWKHGLAYVLVTVLTFHAHYLVCLTVAAQIIWAMIVPCHGTRVFFGGSTRWNLRIEQTKQSRDREGAVGSHPKGCLCSSTDHSQTEAHSSARSLILVLIAVGSLCAPMTLHFLYYRMSTFQGLDWIRPPTWSKTREVFEQISFGTPGLILLCVAFPAFIVSAFLLRTRRASSINNSSDSPITSTQCTEGFAATSLLLLWFGFAGLGLIVISWLRHPVLVDRYAIPAMIPALLFPLIIAQRFHRVIPVLILVVFVAFGGYRWWQEGTKISPGFRELVEFLEYKANPNTDTVVLVVDNRTHPDWDDAERLPLAYYPLSPRFRLTELHIAPDGFTVENRDALKDPNGMWLIVLGVDPFPVLEHAGRKSELIEIESRRFRQLLFEPYRLVWVLPKQP